jgi:uncharacterized secreted repeat protein (TIGR03808 family)
LPFIGVKALFDAGHGKFEWTRRIFLANGVSLAAASLGCLKALAGSDPVAARTLALWRGCRDAAKTGAAFELGEGEFSIYPLYLPEGARLVGQRGKTVLHSSDGRPILVGRKLRSAHIEAIAFRGGNAVASNPSLGLVHFEDVEGFQLHGVEVADFSGIGVSNLRSGGEIFGCTIRGVGDAGYHSLDGRGVAFGRDGDGNRIADCGNAGVRVWTSQAWVQEGSTIRNNDISDIRSAGGGTGQNGNGVNVFRAAGVTIEDNRIARCAFSAVRNNGGKDFVAARNRCSNLGERAMYAEFDFKNAVFENNTISFAAAGISLTNFDAERNVGCGGRAVGNRIVQLQDLAPDDDWRANPGANAAKVGIEAEGDVLVAGNRIVGPARIGIQCGFGQALRSVVCRENVIEAADYGVAFTSLAPLNPPTDISDNHLLGSRKARIAATRYQEILPGDLFGATSAYPSVHIGRNYDD